MSEQLDRRQLLQTAAAGALASAGLAASLSAQPPIPSRIPAPGDQALLAERLAGHRAHGEVFSYCLNTATLRGHSLPLETLIEITAQAGYTGIEPWIDEIEAFVKAGGKLPDLAKKLADLGLTVESAIGFSNWVVEDPAQRQAGLEQARRDMDLVKQLGGSRIAAPPAGATEGTPLPLLAMAERYAALLEAGRQIGVLPQLEVWGFSVNLSRLGESACVAIESGHPEACLLPDVYHIYKGGSDFAGLQLFSDRAIHVFHMNDYPAEPTRDKIGDEHRVYPGLGVAPMSEILSLLQHGQTQCVLSLELFNRDYWKQDPLEVARQGLASMKQAVQQAQPGQPA